MNLLDLPDNVLDTVYTHLGLRSLLSLKVTCRFLNDVSNTRLFRHVYFFDPDKEMALSAANTDFACKYTLLPVSGIARFTDFLRGNVHLARLIASVVFHTALDGPAKDLLALLLNTAGGALQEVRFTGHDVRLLAYLSDNSADATAHVGSMLYENDEVYERPTSQDHDGGALGDDCHATQHILLADRRKLRLVSSQLLSPLDAERVIQLKLALSDVEIKFPNAYPDSGLSRSLVSYWSSSLKSLTLTNYASYLYFTKGLRNYTRASSGSRHSAGLFSSLETLSVCFTDDVSNNDDLRAGLRLLDLANIKNLEIKYKRTLFNNPTATNLELIDYWNGTIDFASLRQFSLVNLNSNNMLANNIYQHEISENTNLCYAIMDHLNLFSSNTDTLTSLNLCLNTFPVVPLVSAIPTGNPNVFFADPKYLARKRELFDRIFRLRNLEILVIPDFLFNWWPFLEENKTMGFHYGKSYSSANIMIPALYRRFNSFESGSGLDITDYPPLRYGFNSEFRLNDYLDSLVPAIVGFVERLPRLRLLNLGGVLLEIHRDSHGTVEKLNGVYDSWVFTDFPIGE